MVKLPKWESKSLLLVGVVVFMVLLMWEWIDEEVDAFGLENGAVLLLLFLFVGVDDVAAVASLKLILCANSRVIAKTKV